MTIQGETKGREKKKVVFGVFDPTEGLFPLRPKETQSTIYNGRMNRSFFLLFENDVLTETNCC